MNAQDALNTLSTHLNNASTTLEDWDVTEYKDALVFSIKAPARSNRLYLVKATKIKSFSLTSQTTEEAYSELE
jgi:hypothetical protein